MSSNWLYFFFIVLGSFIFPKIECQNWVIDYLLPDDYDKDYPPNYDSPDGLLPILMKLRLQFFQ